MTTVKNVVVSVLIIAGICTSIWILDYTSWKKSNATAVPPAPDYTAVIAVAKVFGQVEGCKKTDAGFIGMVAETAKAQGLSPALLASVVAVESACDPLAISSRGAVGLTQIRLAVWKDKYDFGGRDNPFNPADNLRVGSTILQELIKAKGVKGGVRAYQGTGKDCPTCDDKYTSKIFQLASQ
jgi:hypothetical protein